MVNKKNSGGRSVLLSLLFLSSFLFTLQHSPVLAQKVSDHYVSSLQENGVLYYLHPLKGVKEIKGRDKLRFDITHLTTNDSARVHISLYSSKDMNPGQIVIHYDSLKCTANLHKVFVESHRKDWHYRYRFTVHLTDLRNIFHASLPPEWIIYADSHQVAMQMGRWRWKKQSDIVKKIIKLIQLNSKEEQQK